MQPNGRTIAQRFTYQTRTLPGTFLLCDKTVYGNTAGKGSVFASLESRQSRTSMQQDDTTLPLPGLGSVFIHYSTVERGFPLEAR